jgi:spore coat protein CotH
MEFAPQSVLVDVYLNGSYQGIYALMERIEVNTGRVEIDEGNDSDTGYLIEIGGTADGDVYGVHYFHTNSFTHAYVKVPSSENRTAAQMQFITDYVQKADAAVISLTDYEDYIDIPSLIDWFILHELTFNMDSSFRRSCFITKDTGGKLKMGPPWDFDLAFGNHFRVRPNTWATTASADGYVGVTWMDYLLKDSSFTSQLKARWSEVGDMLLQTALDEIELSEKAIHLSQEEHFKTWNVLRQRLGHEPRGNAVLTTHSSHIQFLRDFLAARKEWMDKAISAL